MEIIRSPITDKPGIFQAQTSSSSQFIAENLAQNRSSGVGNVDLVKDLSIPVLTTLIGLAAWTLLAHLCKRLIAFASSPVFDVYFMDQGVRRDVLKVPIGPGFNLPIYILGKKKFSNLPFMKLLGNHEWTVLVNIVAPLALDIYSVGRQPSYKYSLGEYLIHEDASRPLGPEAWGAGAKLANEARLPIEIELQVYLGRRDIPFSTKKLTLLQ